MALVILKEYTRFQVGKQDYSGFSICVILVGRGVKRNE